MFYDLSYLFDFYGLFDSLSDLGELGKLNSLRILLLEFTLDNIIILQLNDTLLVFLKIILTLLMIRLKLILVSKTLSQRIVLNRLLLFLLMNL